MWKKLYTLGLALPRILFRPGQEFQVIIPTSGKPFVHVPSVQATIRSQPKEAVERIVPVLAEVTKLSKEMTLVRANLKQLVSLFSTGTEDRYNVLFEIIRMAEKHDIDLVKFIRLQDLEYAFREKERSKKEH
jgi:hypothetical protein